MSNGSSRLKVALRMQTDQQCHFNPRQLGEQMVEPQGRAFPTWRQVAATPSAWTTIAHLDSRNLRRVVKPDLSTLPVPQ